jgi:hypothetical protein
MTAFAKFRRVRAALVVAAAASIVGACSDRSPDLAAPRRMSAPSGMPDADVIIVTGGLTASGDTLITTFTVDPSISAAYKIGDEHYLWVDAKGVCDLGSPYGPSFWNDRCAPKTTPTVVTARSWKDMAGRPHIDFEPALRFAPAKGKNKSSAMIFMHDVEAAYDPHATILFCRDGVCIDEAAKYEFLETDRNKHEGYVYRPILHFSGYEVHCGLFSEF